MATATKTKRTQPRMSAKNPKFATLVVGPSEDKFVIHQELLTFYSPYFRAALTGGFKEAKSGTIALTEENLHIVKFFIHWLYHLRFPTENDCAKLWALYAADEDDDGQLITQNLVRMYVFADKFNIPRLHLDVITELYVHVEGEADNALPDTDMIRYAFTNLADSSPLCEYIVDAYCFFACHRMWEDFVEVDWYPPFVARVLTKYTESRHDDTPGPCHYHHHESEEERAECHLDLYGE